MENYLCFFVYNILIGRVVATLTLTASSPYAVDKQDYILTCKSLVVIAVALWVRNGTDVMSMYIESNVCKIFDYGIGLSSNYGYNCRDNKTFNVIIAGDRIIQEDGSRWQCKDAAGGGGASDILTFSVGKPPTSGPVVTGYNGTILYHGNKLTLTCTVQGGTPLATLSWTCKGSSVTGTDKSTTTTAINEVTVNIDSTYNRQTCVCKAEHLTWTTDKTAESQQMVVYYPPSSGPVVSGYNGSKLYVNDSAVLICHVTGGYPLAILSWSCNGQDFPGTNRSLVNTAINELSLTATANLNGKSCTCKGRHQITSYSKDINSTTFIVYYVDLFTIAQHVTFDNTQDIKLSCSAKGNTNEFIFHQWTQKVGSAIIRKLDGSNTVYQTVLDVPYSSYQDVGTYTCYVYNSYGKLMKSKDIKVSVNDKPVITDTIKIKEQGENGELIVDFYSVPKPLKVEWSTEGSTISLSEKYRQSNIVVPISLTLHNVKVTLEGYRAQLSITSFTEADYKTYILRVENNKGKAEQVVDFQRKANKQDVSYIGLTIGVTVGVVVILAVVTIAIVIRYRRNKRKNETDTDAMNEKKYEDLQVRKETNVYHRPVTEVHNFTNSSATSEHIEFESIQNTDDSKLAYEEIGMTRYISPTS